MSGRALWFIITPIYKPAPGGAAIYYDTLARALANDGCHVVVATEAFPEQPEAESIAVDEGSLTVKRLFPFRAGRARKDWRSYLAYVMQNLRMLGLPAELAKAVRQYDPSSVTVLIHASLFHNRSVMPHILDRLRRQLPGRTQLVADVRDPLFTDSVLKILAQFDSVIGCSRAIADRLRAGLPEQVNVHHIPIPFSPAPRPDVEEVSNALVEYGLEGVPYLLNPNGVSEQKSYPLMLETVRALRQLSGHEETVLVTIGRARDWCDRDKIATVDGVLRYLGPVSNVHMLALTSAARGVIVLSEIEGLPRSALETFAIGTPLIGPDISEFRETIPEAIVTTREAKAIAKQVAGICDGGKPQTYPIGRHAMPALLPLYRALERA